MPLVLYLKSHCHSQGHLDFLLCYLLRVFFFIILYFTFRSKIHFVLIFVKDVSLHLHFFFFFFSHGCLVIPASNIKKTILLHYITFAPLSKINWLYLFGPIYGLAILFHWSICQFFHQYHPILITVSL